MARRARHTTAIADAISQGGLKRPGDNVLSSILTRAAKGREVVKVGKGMWGLKAEETSEANQSGGARREEAAPSKANSAETITEERGGYARCCEIDKWFWIALRPDPRCAEKGRVSRYTLTRLQSKCGREARRRQIELAWRASSPVG